MWEIRIFFYIFFNNLNSYTFFLKCNVDTHFLKYVKIDIKINIWHKVNK